MEGTSVILKRSKAIPGAAQWRRAQARYDEAVVTRDRAIIAAVRSGEYTAPEIAEAFGFKTRGRVYQIVADDHARETL
jgi:hypothetical protein